MSSKQLLAAPLTTLTRLEGRFKHLRSQKKLCLRVEMIASFKGAAVLLDECRGPRSGDCQDGQEKKTRYAFRSLSDVFEEESLRKEADSVGDARSKACVRDIE